MKKRYYTLVTGCVQNCFAVTHVHESDIQTEFYAEPCLAMKKSTIKEIKEEGLNRTEFSPQHDIDSLCNEFDWKRFDPDTIKNRYVVRIEDLPNWLVKVKKHHSSIYSYERNEGKITEGQIQELISIFETRSRVDFHFDKVAYKDDYQYRLCLESTMFANTVEEDTSDRFKMVEVLDELNKEYRKVLLGKNAYGELFLILKSEFSNDVFDTYIGLIDNFSSIDEICNFKNKDELRFDTMYQRKLSEAIEKHLLEKVYVVALDNGFYESIWKDNYGHLRYVKKYNSYYEKPRYEDISYKKKDEILLYWDSESGGEYEEDEDSEEYIEYDSVYLNGSNGHVNCYQKIGEDEYVWGWGLQPDLNSSYSIYNGSLEDWEEERKAIINGEW